MPLALLALAIGAFGIGTTEFVITGLLPAVADDFGVSIPTAGLLVTGYALGVVAMFMRRFDFPVAPVVIGMILGPMAEQALRQALTISQGDWSTFVTRPGSALILALAALALAGPRIWAVVAARR